MHIKKHPGIRYRQLLRLTGLSNGRMSFHLKKLNKSKLVKAKRLASNKTRYYPASKLDIYESRNSGETILFKRSV
jgi:predicted transcriptional regulator